MSESPMLLMLDCMLRHGGAQNRFPEMLDDPVPFPEILDDPALFPEMLDNPAPFPEMLDDPAPLVEVWASNVWFVPGEREGGGHEVWAAESFQGIGLQSGITNTTGTHKEAC